MFNSQLPPLDTELLLAHVLRRDRLWLATHPHPKLTLGQQRRYRRLLKKRLQAVPIAYLTHHKEFFGRDFYVDARALIPRPDSEPVVAAVIEQLKTIPRPHILEIGTGSGCLAVTLACELSKSTIMATDISRGALAVAARNLATHHVTNRVTLKRQSLLDDETGRYDLVLANLPYVPRHWLKDSPQSKNLSHEPLTALDGGADGLTIIRQFLSQFAARPNAPRLVLEHGDGQHRLITRLARQLLPPHHTRTIKDLAGRPRAILFELRTFDKS